MALMSWATFHEEHSRPFMVFADMEARQQRRFEQLNSLVQAMDLGGSYALRPAESSICVAFAREVGAKKFAESVYATRSAREGRSAGQWAFAFGAEMDATIMTLLASGTRKSLGTRTGRKRNKRAMPF